MIYNLSSGMFNPTKPYSSSSSLYWQKCNKPAESTTSQVKKNTAQIAKIQQTHTKVNQFRTDGQTHSMQRNSVQNNYQATGDTQRWVKKVKTRGVLVLRRSITSQANDLLLLSHAVNTEFDL